MTRYQIKIYDGDLTDLTHEVASQIIAGAGEAVVGQSGAPDPGTLYPAVFDTCKEVLKAHTRGFHVCGCMAHCDRESVRTELASPYAPVPDLAKMDYRDPRIHRYVLSIDVPLVDFVRVLEVKVLHSVASHAAVKNWHRLLFPIIRTAVETTLGKYLYHSPCCNRGEYLCEIGTCTEFDPWERVRPKAVPDRH